MKTLITGGAGYIGSHMSLKLLEQGHDVIILDDFSNSYEESITKIKQISGYDITLYRGDIKSEELLEEIFANNEINQVFHFAASKAIGESVLNPLKYYNNNVLSSLKLLDVMVKYQVKSLIFSSSAAVYGESNNLPIKEDDSKFPTNPYGMSKLICENIFKDTISTDPEWKVVSLRYFNPIGSHNSGLIGESPKVPYNIMPVIFDVLNGNRKFLEIYGKDYSTPDGTCVRDYIHIDDLINGHLVSLKYIQDKSGFFVFNLGTGKGTSILELLTCFEEITSKKIPIKFGPKRAGDVDQLFTSPEKANNELAWKAEKDLTDMCNDTWRWVKNYPQGFG